MFPKLKKLAICRNLCTCGNATCDLETFVPQILINKDNQLTIIQIDYICLKSMHLVWKELKHCKAAKNVEFKRVVVDSPLTVTYEDMEAICHLPNIQHFRFRIFQRDEGVENGTCGRLRELMESAAKNHSDFQFDYKLYEDTTQQYKQYSLYRINF